jgi:nucleoside-diphosphate-sugar epimerase
MKVLLTGAAGYIGSVLVPVLLDRGCSVRVVDRLFFGRENLSEHPRLEVVREDTRRMSASLLEGIDAVVDMAAISNDPTGELFSAATWEINHAARVRTARMASAAGVRRYILFSSTSVYGRRSTDEIVDEASSPAPLTVYAKANVRAEEEILPRASGAFCAFAVRPATVFGVSPRMRFDLAINGMTLGAYETGRLPLLRDGTQWRPLVHVRDVAEAVAFLLLEAAAPSLAGQVFNIGAAENNYRLSQLAALVVSILPRKVEVEWYGEPDPRSYRVSFDRIERLGWRATRTVADGIKEVFEALESGALRRTDRTITLRWYQELVRWHEIVRRAEMYGGIVEIEPVQAKDTAGDGIESGNVS